MFASEPKDKGGRPTETYPGSGVGFRKDKGGGRKLTYPEAAVGDRKAKRLPWGYR